jgi:hypothetical protein
MASHHAAIVVNALQDLSMFGPLDCQPTEIYEYRQDVDNKSIHH